MTESKIDTFSNLKIGDKFTLSKVSFVIYEKKGNNKFKVVKSLFSNNINSEDKIILDDKLFSLVYRVSE